MGQRAIQQGMPRLWRTATVTDIMQSDSVLRNLREYEEHRKALRRGILIGLPFCVVAWALIIWWVLK
jgi:hypothetical protein